MLLLHKQRPFRILLCAVSSWSHRYVRLFLLCIVITSRWTHLMQLHVPPLHPEMQNQNLPSQKSHNFSVYGSFTASGPILALTNRINWEEMTWADKTSKNFSCFIISSLLLCLFIRRLSRDRTQMMEIIMTASVLTLDKQSHKLCIATTEIDGNFTCRGEKRLR